MRTRKGGWVKRADRPGDGALSLLTCLSSMFDAWRMGGSIGKWSLILREWLPAKSVKGKRNAK